MPIETWGLLTKSADDATKIEEEIDNRIADHNADPNAHGLADMALYAHRTGDVLDHLEYSVKPLKLGLVHIQEDFDSLDGYMHSAGASLNVDVGRVELTTNAVINDYQYLFKYLDTYPSSFTWNKNRILETTLSLNSVSDVEARVFLGGQAFRNHIGFKVENNTLKGSVGNGDVETTVDLMTISANTKYAVKAVFTAGSKCEFYVNGVKQGEITTNLPSGLAYISYLITIQIMTYASASKSLYFSYWDVMQEF